MPNQDIIAKAKRLTKKFKGPLTLDEVGQEPENGFKTAHIPLEVHQDLKREVFELSGKMNLRKLIVYKLRKPLTKEDIKNLKAHV